MSPVLLVEDNELNAAWLRALLEAHGYAVETARHGVEALAKARQTVPCLMITDLLMPLMDGYTLLRHWKADDRLQHIPVIVYTATYTQPDDERLALELGADAFLLKPSEPEPLIARIEHVLTGAAQGTRAPSIASPQADVTHEMVVLRKLEEKALQLEQANRQLAASEGRLRAILDAEPECVKLIDHQGRLLEMNPAGLAMLEVNTLAEAQSRPLAHYIVPKYRRAFQDLHRQVMAGGSGAVEFEIEGCRGTRRWMETHAVPLRGKDGRITGFLGITRDVSARQQAQRARAQAELFRDLLDRTTDLVYIADAESGRVLDCNEALPRLLGYDRDQVLRMTVPDFSTPSETAGSWSDDVAVLRSRGSQALTTSDYRRKDGTTVPIEVNVSYVLRDQRAIVVAVARDVTERRRQEQRIAHLTRVLRMQNAIKAAVLQIRDTGEMLREVCRVATDVGGYDHALLAQVQPAGLPACTIYQAGTVGLPEVSPLEIGEGAEPDSAITGRALRSGEIVVCNDLSLSTESRIVAREQLLALGIRSIVALPLIVEGTRAGALTLLSRRAESITDEELRLLQDISATIAFGLRSRNQADAADYLTYYDPLTGLAKRGLFCERVEASMAQQPAVIVHPVVLAFDIHDLSGFNDTFGRAVGDTLVREVADRARLVLASGQQVGYLGSGTFVLVFFEQQTVAGESLIAMLESVVFAEPFKIEGRDFRVTYSSGMAQYPTDGRTAAALVERAEAALRRAKESGERYLHYKLQMHSEVAARLQLEHELRAAIDGEQFVLYYQPQVDIASGRIASLEALLRWRRPGGLAAPAAFLPLLESTGLIVTVGAWVLRQAARDCIRCRASGIGPVRIAVNVSAQQIRRRAFVDEVLRAVEGWSGGGYGLDLEITETSLLVDLEDTSRKLRQLREAGLRVAIDDFGTGYSSLSLLPTLPIDTLKIDRAFVRGLPQDRASVALTASIIQIASAFNLATVAEGVETPEQLALLRDLRCGQSQGYLHSQPVPIEQIDASLLSER